MKMLRKTANSTIYRNIKTARKFDTKAEIILCISGDGNVSFEEFVEIVSNMGATTDRTADQEEKELRDAFRVSE
jgi:Ca2+-binding EF-hand superfamily protein